MSRLLDHHKELKNGVGKCSVPMWCNGVPAGFCDNQAFGKRPDCAQYRDSSGELRRHDMKYNGYVPALACPGHGGQEKKEVLNLCDFCKLNFGSCKSDPVFGSGIGFDNVYECDSFVENH